MNHASDPITPGDPDGDDALAALEAELAGALEQQGLAPARPSFRAALRASFVAGRFEGDGAPTGVVARALEAHTVPDARPAFRAELRAAFLTAAAPASQPDAASAAGPPAGSALASDVPAPGRRGGRPAGGARHARSASARGASDARDRDGARPTPARRQRARAWGRVGAALAVAAAVLFVVFQRDAPSAAQWRALGGSGTTVASGPLPAAVMVDGAAVTDVQELGERLARGARVETGASALRVALGDDVVLELGEHSSAWLPAPSADGDIALLVEHGSLRIATGPGFRARAADRGLTVATPELEARVVGTVFGIDCGVGYTCVCCLEGEVATRSLVAGVGDGAVLAGRTRVTFKEGRALDLELVPDHSGPLVGLRTIWSS